MKTLLPNYNSPQELKLFLESHGLAMHKRFGQNFLVNENARKNIADSLMIDEGTSVWEVGPGLGAMTFELLKRNATLTVFEIDKGFLNLLRNFFSSYIDSGRLRIVEGDVLKTWKGELESHGEPERFFGNLPYNIAASLIAETIENNVRFEKAVFTVQKEVATRMTAKCGSENYSSLSVLCQWSYDISTVMELAGGNFWPVPKVASRVLKMTKKTSFPNCENPILFSKMQRALFSSRRKNLRNNLSLFLSSYEKAEAALAAAKIDMTLRAEDLSIDSMLRLSDVINADIMRKG